MHCSTGAYEKGPLPSETMPAPQRMRMRRASHSWTVAQGDRDGKRDSSEQKEGWGALEAAWLPHRPLLLHRDR